MPDHADHTSKQPFSLEAQELLVETFFSEPAASRELPAEEVTPRSAYNLVNSEMMLDGDPNKNLATFVTTWMEPEADW